MAVIKKQNLRKKKSVRVRKDAKPAPFEIFNGLPPDGAVAVDGKAIARAPKDGCSECQWINTGATLVGGRITAVTQAGYRTCWVHVPVLLPNGTIGFYKVSWSESCGGARTLDSWW